MSDWIGLSVILAILLSGVYGLAHVSTPRKPITKEEFEKRAREAPSLLSAGVMGLQKILEPGVEKAVEVQEDFRQGHLDGEQESGEGSDIAAGADLGSSESEKHAEQSLERS